MNRTLCLLFSSILLVGFLRCPTGVFASSGGLDPAFGVGGVTFTAIGPLGSSASGVALQSDGQIVAVGSSSRNNLFADPSFAVARYTSRGQLDRGFGTGGAVITELPVNDTFPPGYSVAFANTAAIQRDGKIIVAGAAGNHLLQALIVNVFGIVRYNPDGQLDASFGSAGKVTTTFPTKNFETSGSSIEALAIQSDGKVVAVGNAFDGGAFAADGNVNHSTFALARYLPDGQLDEQFGSGGLVTTDLGSNAQPKAVTVDGQGRITVAGKLYGPLVPPGEAPAPDTFVLARYDGDGSLDATFGDAGTLTSSFGGSLAAATFGADGKIIAVGSAQFTPRPHDVEVLVRRYQPDGVLDQSFGSAGAVSTVVTGAGDLGSNLAVDQAGTVAVLGCLACTTQLPEIAVLLYKADGSLDTQFGVGGVAPIPFEQMGRANGVAWDVDGRIVVVGSTGSFSSTKFALARYRVSAETAPTHTTRIRSRETRLLPRISER